MKSRAASIGSVRIVSAVLFAFTAMYLGGQDVETAQYISHKANKSASSILNMSLNDAWLFQRGAEPKQVEKYIMQEEVQCG